MASQPRTCIVGAGPGGLYTALSLAQKGIPSLVLDRAVFPRRKVCGDILTSNVLRALHDLDPTMIDTLLRAHWAMEIKASTFASHEGHPVEVPFESPSNVQRGLPSCISARRVDFDAFLLAYARKSPLIEVREGTQVRAIRREGHQWHLELAEATKGRKETEVLKCDFALLSAGANSPLATQMVPGHQLKPKHSAVGIRTYYEGVQPGPRPDRSEFYLFDRKLMPGGLYLTPFADGRFNVNIVMRYDIFKKKKVHLRSLLTDYIEGHPDLRPRFAQAVQTGAPEGSVLFFGTKKRPISNAGCLLIGDAAGLTDATNANGIGHAMISGGLAANTVADAYALGRTDAAFLRQYDKAVYARLQNALLPGKVMRYLFANRLVSHLSASILQSSFRRLNSKAIEELVYTPSTTRTLLNPRFYYRLFSKEKSFS